METGLSLFNGQTDNDCPAANSQALYQPDDREKARAFSVRCVKSIDSLK